MVKVLSGIRVIDMGTFITGPAAGMLLADMGAEVIKVENPDGGDPFRAFRGDWRFCWRRWPMGRCRLF